MQWFYTEALQDERIVPKIEGDFGREIGPDMQLFLPMCDADLPIYQVGDENADHNIWGLFHLTLKLIFSMLVAVNSNVLSSHL